MDTCRLLVPVALISLALPASAWAQRKALSLEPLEVDQLIKVRTVNHGVHIGRLTSLTGDTLFLSPQRGSSVVEIAAIDQLWVRGAATRKGAVIGGVTGALLGALSFAFMSYAVCDAASCSVDAGATGLGAMTGGAVGAITGASLGAMLGQWDLKYP